MSRSSRAVVTVPTSVRRGEVFSVRAIVQHEMETGFRHTEQGIRVPRDLIREFVCSYNGRVVFRADLHPGIGANPIFVFNVKADQSGTLECRWSGDNQYLVVVQEPLRVV